MTYFEFRYTVDGMDRVATWQGSGWEDAARNLVDAIPGASVYAWRKAPGPVVTVLGRSSIDGVRVA